jgi:hypothetical protein
MKYSRAMNKQTSVLHYHKAPVTPSPDIALSLFKSPIASRTFNLAELELTYPEMKGMDFKERHVFVTKLRVKIAGEITEHDHRRKVIDADLKRLNAKREVYSDLERWSSESGLRIERPSQPSFRRLRKAVAEGRTVYLGKDPVAHVPAMDFEKEVFCHAEIMVIEHDWAAAFSESNIDDAAIRLPYDVCAFEFMFAARPVIAFAIQVDADIVFCPAVYHDDAWLLTDFVLPLDFDPLDERCGFMIELLDAIASQIKAACIALDAEVAQSETVREPHAGAVGNHRAAAMKPHHVISLARRRARLPRAEGAGNDPHTRKRLHFRRGHWRHFEVHKTWIKWMLVGDPDMGFVEKHYRL